MGRVSGGIGGSMFCDDLDGFLGRMVERVFIVDIFIGRVV